MFLELVHALSAGLKIEIQNIWYFRNILTTG